MKESIFTLATSFLIIVLSGCGAMTQDTDKKVSKESVKATNAAEFIANYSANKADYDAKYLDQVITVSGPVANAVVVDGGYNIEIKGEDELQTVSCDFDKTSIKDGALPKVGVEITVRGKCTGYIEEEMMGMKTINMVQCLIN